MSRATSCENCPIGRTERAFLDAEEMCRHQFDDMRWCPMKVRFMGKEVAYLAYRELDENWCEDHVVFDSFEGARRHVESQSVSAVKLPYQFRRNDGRRPGHFWTVEGSSLFGVQEFDFDNPSNEKLEEYDPVFEREIADTKDGERPNYFEISQRHIDSLHVRYFQNYGMTRWYTEDDILERQVARYELTGSPETGDGDTFGREILWHAHPVAYARWDDGYGEPDGTVNDADYMTIRMVEVGEA